VSNNGAITLSGYLADDSGVTQRSFLSRDGRYPLYVPVYNHGVDGSISGWLQFTNGATSCFTEDSQVLWIKKSGGSIYTGGFTNQSSVTGAWYDSTPASLLSITSGEVILTGGNLSTPITNSFTLEDDTITVDPSATDSLVLAIDRPNGEIRGSFVNAGHTNLVYSLILQPTDEARGYFIGTSQGGLFILK
jgi:hypothetical protein